MASKKSKVKFIYKGPESSLYKPDQVLEVTERFAEPYRQSSYWREVKEEKPKGKKSKDVV